jgi:hypothetical protein
MSVFKSGFLGAAFLLASDIAFAGGTSMLGLHGYIVDAGTNLGAELGTHVDWVDWWENGELGFVDTATDPCLSSGGHYHGDFCHVPGQNELATVSSAPPIESLEFE